MVAAADAGVSKRTCSATSGGQPPSFVDSEDNQDDPGEPNPLLDCGSERARVGLARPGAAGSRSSAVARPPSSSPLTPDPRPVQAGHPRPRPGPRIRPQTSD